MFKLPAHSLIVQYTFLANTSSAKQKEISQKSRTQKSCNHITIFGLINYFTNINFHFNT